jgi:uncharacterized protein (TIGR03067 family)
MRRTLVGALTLALLAGTAAGGGGGKKDKDKDELQGTWNVTAFEGGDPASREKKSVPAGEMALVFSGDKVTVKLSKGKQEEATFKIESSTRPKQIDLTKKTETKDKGETKETQEGIYELQGDTLRLAFSTRGSKGKRPVNFERPDLVIIHLKKQGKS